MLRKLLKWPLRAALRSSWLRPKIAFELRRAGYADLEVTIPLSHGMAVPIRREDFVHSFTEIFLAHEYGDFLERMPLPRRWLDLGCHAGFFSTLLAWEWRKRGSEDFRAFLVDADPRVAADIAHLVKLNRLDRQFEFAAGLIGEGTGQAEFALRDGMGSSTDLRTRADAVQQVPILGPAEMREKLPPPIDLVKLDIEGAEFCFIEHYAEVLSAAAHVVAEWHSWDSHGAGEGQMIDAMAKRGLVFVAALQPRKLHSIQGKPLSTGCHLYKNLERTCAA
jgi:FkbM family methyltransferase